MNEYHNLQVYHNSHATAHMHRTGNLIHI